VGPQLVDDRYAGATPLHYAAKAGFIGTMKVFLEPGADSEALDDDGLTPMGRARRQDHRTRTRPAASEESGAHARRNPT